MACGWLLGSLPMLSTKAQTFQGMRIGRWGIPKRNTRDKNMVSVRFLLLSLRSETRSLLAPRGQFLRFTSMLCLKSVWGSEAWLWTAVVGGV